MIDNRPELHGSNGPDLRGALERQRAAAVELGRRVAFAPMTVSVPAAAGDGERDAISTIVRARRLVLTSPPGGGKTRALLEAQAAVAASALAELDARGPEAVTALALYVDLATARPGEGIDELLARAKAQAGIPVDAAPTILLFDRAERVSDVYLLDGLTLLLQAGGISSPAVIVACREAEWDGCRGWLEGTGTPRAELLPLADEVVRDALSRALPTDVAAAAAEWLARDEALARAVRIPLALGALLECARREPPSRWRRVCVLETLLDAILDTVPDSERAPHRAALADVAFSSRGRALADQVDTLAMGLGVNRDAMIEAGAVVGRGATLQFVEPLLAEHCAAAALAFRFHDDPRQLVERLAPLDTGAEHGGSAGPRAEWLASVYHLSQEPVRFLAALVTLEDGAELVAHCLAAPDAADPEGPAGATALVSRLIEYDRSAGRPALDAGRLEALRDALVARGEVGAAAVAAAAAAEGRAEEAGPDTASTQDSGFDRYRDLLAFGRDLRASDRAGVEAVLRQAASLAARQESDGDFERGIAAEAAGDLRGALEHFQAALDRSPDSPDVLAAIGRSLRALGDVEVAVEPLERACSLRPESARFAHELGAALRDVGRVEAAAARLSDAAALAPHRPEYEMAAGEALAEIGQMDAAEAAMARAAAMRPERGGWHDALGQVRLEMGRPKAAVEAFERAFALVPDDVGLIRRLARAHAASGEPGRAVELLSRAAGMAGDDAGLLGDLGRALARAGDIDAAIDALRAAVAIDDIWPADHALLARLIREAALREGGDEDRVDGTGAAAIEAALRHAERAAELAPESAIARQERAAARAAAGVAGPDSDAGRSRERSIEPSPAPADRPREDSAITLGQLATLYEESGDIQAAYRTLVRAAERSPLDASIARQAGILARRLGRPADAAAHLAAAAELVPDDAGLLAELAATFQEAGDREQAFVVLRRIADQDPGNGAAQIAVARAARALGRLDAARDAIRAARTAMPDAAEVDALEGELALAVGDEDAARAAFERAVERAPEVADHAVRLADLYAAIAPERALDVLAGAPDDGRVHARRGALLAGQQRWSAAAAALAAAIESGEASAEIVAALGTALLRDGRPEAAVDALAGFVSSWRTRSESQGEPPAIVFPPLAEALEAVGRSRDALVAWGAAGEIALDVEQRLKHSRLASRLGAFEEAVIAAQRAAAEHPDLAAPRAALADAYAARGLLESAVRAAKAAADLEPAEPAHRLRLAGFERSLGKREAAIDTLLLAVADHPDSAEINLVLGRLLHEAGRVAEARTRLEAAAERAPDDPAILRTLAETFVDTDPGRAAELLAQAARRSPGDPGVRARLARALWASGQTAASAREWEAAAGLCDAAGPEAAETAAEAWRELARCRLALDDASGATIALGAARVRSGSAPDPEILRLTADLAARAEDWVGALDALEQAVTLRPNDSELLRELGRLRLAQGDRSGGIAALEAALEIEPSDPAALELLAGAYARDGRHAEAAERYEALCALMPGEPRPLVELGRCRLASGAPAGASAALRRAAELAPSDVAIRCLLAEAERDAGRPEAALREAEIAVALDPDSADAQRALGAARRARGDASGALDPLARAAELAPDDPITFETMASLADEAGDVEALREALHRAVILQPDNADTAIRFAEIVALDGWDTAYVTPTSRPPVDASAAALVERTLAPLVGSGFGPRGQRAARALSTVLARRGDFDEASSALQIASEGGPDEPTAAVFDVEALLQRAWLRLHVGDSEGALAAARLARAHGADDARAHGLIGLAHAALGEHLAASRALRAAVERAPCDANLGLLLADALERAGRLEDAAAALDAARTAGAGARAEVAMGELALRRGDAGEAVAALERGVAADKRDADTWRLLATARTEGGDWPGAVEALERAARLAPERADWQADLAVALLRVGRLEEARMRFARASVLDPSSLDHRCGDAEAAIALGLEDEARATLDAVLAAEPEHARARALLGRLELEAGRPEHARDALASAVKSLPDDAELHRALGRAARGAGADDEALGALERAAALDSGVASTYVELGELHEARLESDDAIQAYQQALANDPDSAELHVRLGRLCGASGMVEKALAHLARAATLDPDDPRPHLEAGRVLVGAEAYDLALDAYEEALGRGELDERAQVLCEAGQAAMRVNDYARAKRYLDGANETASTPRIRRLLAEVSALRYIGRMMPNRRAPEAASIGADGRSGGARGVGDGTGPGSRSDEHGR